MPATQTASFAALLITRNVAGEIVSVRYEGNKASATQTANECRAENEEDIAWDLKKQSRGWKGVVTARMSFEVLVVSAAATARIEELDSAIEFYSQDEADHDSWSDACEALSAYIITLV